MSKRHQFIKSLIGVLKHNRDGSHVTQANRRQQLVQMLHQLYDAGYQLEHICYIKQRHVRYLVQHWQTEQKSTATIKNRLSNLRWLMRKINREVVVPSNTDLGIPKRVYLTNADKSYCLPDGDLDKITDRFVQLSLRGQQLFGLRFEESLKLQPYIADGGDYLYIKNSWSKGGRERIIPILNEAQRAWLEECKAFVRYKQNSLIPQEVTYKSHRRYVIHCCERAGIHKRHGLRHQYTQQRYRSITGWDCPAKGGCPHRQLPRALKSLDRAARLQVSQELGHSRIDGITSVYLGR
ncbi:MAG: phage integrase N-terminal domain-containing protein [Pseudomonadota bacterium]